MKRRSESQNKHSRVALGVVHASTEETNPEIQENHSSLSPCYRKRDFSNSERLTIVRIDRNLQKAKKAKKLTEVTTASLLDVSEKTVERIRLKYSENSKDEIVLCFYLCIITTRSRV